MAQTGAGKFYMDAEALPGGEVASASRAAGTFTGNPFDAGDALGLAARLRVTAGAGTAAFTLQESADAVTWTDVKATAALAVGADQRHVFRVVPGSRLRWVIVTATGATTSAVTDVQGRR